MKLTTTHRYAVTACLHLADVPPGELISCRALCEAGNIPERYVMQLLNGLTVAGAVRSVKGRHGGFALAKPAAQITLLDIMTALDGPLRIRDVGDLSMMAPASRRAIAAAFAAIETETKQQLGGITLAQLRTRQTN
ncbi:MAG: Rrf2 family transcriptional regulator [Planctomycetaceae bacterium]|nr:Rrf2 family transcriptional regulator [Planctomycetaceae bacterium]